MAAGLKTLELIDNEAFWTDLTARTKYLVDGLAAAAADAGIPVSVECEGGMFGLVFTGQGPVRTYAQVAAADVERFKTFFHGMLDEGIYLAPSAFEAGFVSAAHSDDDLNQTIAAAAKVFATL
jgi:glutamate-1-semialdehyde 2,1-aminomutase